MRIPSLTACVIAGAVMLGAAAAHAQEDAKRIISEDAAAFFGGLCISTRGAPDRINQTIAAQQLKALPLSDEEVRGLFEGKAGDSGWIVVSGRGVELQLHVEGTSTCNMRVAESDDALVNETIGTVLETLSARDGFTYEKAMDERRQTNGGEQRLVGYRLFWKNGGWSANLGVSHLAGDGREIPAQTTFMLTLRQAS